MGNLKKCAGILTNTIIKANRPKLKLDIFPNSTPQTKTAPQLDAFDIAEARHLRGEGMPKHEVYTPKPTAHKPLTFDEALKKRLDNI